MGRAKDTAEMTAFARAAGHTHGDGHPLKNPDGLARQFLGRPLGILADLCRLPPLRSLIDVAYGRVAPGAARYLLVRTKHFDDALLAELDRGLEQLVILGAGYDTRAYRFQDRLAQTRVFEVDHPDTARRKRDHLIEAFGALPDHVRFVSLDFSKESIEARLLAEGYDPSKRTFFLWEGVSYYLEADAIDAVLRLVRERSPEGSSVIFDYLHEDVVRGVSSAYGASQIQARVRRLGEPFTFGLPRAGARAFLESRGFDVVSDLSAEDLDRRYLTDERGHTFGRTSGFFGIAWARVRAGN